MENDDLNYYHPANNAIYLPNKGGHLSVGNMGNKLISMAHNLQTYIGIMLLNNFAQGMQINRVKQGFALLPDVNFMTRCAISLYR